jgi:hypothetical protein
LPRRQAKPPDKAPELRRSGVRIGAATNAMSRRLSESDREAEERRTSALIGLIIVLALAIAGVVLIRDLGQKSRLEDCLMSGRTNCAPIDIPPRQY